jgi:hypothetical protein
MATRKTTKKSELAQAGEHLSTAAKEVGTALTHKVEALGDAMSAGVTRARRKVEQRRDDAKAKVGKLVKMAEAQVKKAQAQLHKASASAQKSVAAAEKKLEATRRSTGKKLAALQTSAERKARALQKAVEKEAAALKRPLRHLRRSVALKSSVEEAAARHRRKASSRRRRRNLLRAGRSAGPSWGRSPAQGRQSAAWTASCLMSGYGPRREAAPRARSTETISAAAVAPLSTLRPGRLPRRQWHSRSGDAVQDAAPVQFKIALAARPRTHAHDLKLAVARTSGRAVQTRYGGSSGRFDVQWQPRVDGSL